MQLIRKAVAVVFGAMLMLGLMASPAMADLTIDPYPDGTYQFDSFVASTGMVRFDNDDAPVQAIVKGDTVTLVLDIYNPDKYDGLWRGKRSDAPADTHDASVVDGIMIPAGDFSGETNIWTDESGLVGEAGAQYKAVRFLMSMSKAEFEAMVSNDTDEDMYFAIRRSPWAPSNRGKWMGTSNNYFTVGALSRVSDSTDIPGQEDEEEDETIDGTYSMYNLATGFGMPGILKAQDYFPPRIIVKDGEGVMMLATSTYRYDHMALGVLDDLETGAAVDVEGAAFYSGKLIGERGSDIKGYIFSFPIDADQVEEIIENGGATLPYLVRYVANYDSKHDADWYQAENGQLTFTVAKKSANTSIPELSADYTAVIDAIATVPSDLTMYEEGSVAVLERALAAVDTSKKASSQTEVDAMAKAISDAVAGLGRMADYSAVDAAIASVPEDLSIYTTKSAQALFDAVNAVVRNLPYARQSKVNAMAKAIEKAREGLVQKYIPVRDAIRALPLPKNVKVTDAKAIKAAQALFKALPKAQKKKINNNLQTKLTNCVKALEIVRGWAEKDSEKDNDKNKGNENGGSGTSDTSSSGSGSVNAQTGNQAAIAAAAAGATGAKTKAADGSTNTKTSKTGNTSTDSEKSKEEGDGSDTAQKNTRLDGKADAATEDTTESNQDNVGKLEAANASIAPATILILAGLMIAGIAWFVGAYAYRNRRDVKVRY